MTMRARGKIFRNFYLWHRWLGLFLAVHLILLIVTGTMLVFRDEWLELSEAPHVEHSTANQGTMLPLQTIVDQAKASMPNGLPLAINFDDDNPVKLTLRMGKDGSPLFRGSEKLYFDRYEGALKEISEPGGFWDFVLRLHREFLLGFYGKLYVGLIGFLFLLSLVTGLLVYGPTTPKLAFGFIRRGRPAWTFSDIHKLLGAGSFAWLFVIAFTGLLLATSGQLLKLYQYTELKELKARYVEPAGPDIISVDAAETAVLKAQPEQEIAFITFPGTEFSTAGHYIFVTNGKDGFGKFLNEIVLVDAKTGLIAENRGLPWYLKIALLSEPLHFGNYGGLPLKIIWTVFGLLGLVLAGGGPYLWYLKRKNDQADGRGSKRKPQKRKHGGPYSMPILLAAISFSSILMAISSKVWIDGLASLALAATLALLFQKLFLALRSSQD